MKGILFRHEIWQAKLRVLEEYGKAQTRRVIKSQPSCHCEQRHIARFKDGSVNFFYEHHNTPIHYKPRYQEGEVVYVKEAFCQSCYKDGLKNDDGQNFVCYQADLGSYWKGQNPCLEGGWTSPLFMPAKFARYFPQITKVEAQRVQEITLQGALLEGMGQFGTDLILEYHNQWNSINPKYPWETNPWEFTYTIKLVER